jgi:2-oxoisovalerate dehydrogenase E2 component (dihydrolipoyl transacylase)
VATVREFLLPDLGEGLEDAEVVTWRVAAGDRVELNQTLVEVNTAKALVEIPSPWEGVIEALHANEGDVVKVGERLVSVRLGDDAGPEAADSAATEPTAPDPAAGSSGAAAESTTERPKRRPVLVGYGVAEDEEGAFRAPEAATGRRAGGPVAASPPVRKLAKELGVSLAAVTGSGPNGRVTREDVQAAASAGTADTGGAAAGSAVGAPQEDASRIPLRGTRRLIAEHMARAAREVPMVTTFLTLDASSLQAFRHDIERGEGERVSPLPIVVRALVDVCRDHPRLNSSFDADASEIVLHHRRHVGIATDTDNGLVVPVVHDADRLGILEIAAEIARLSAAARSGRVAPSEISGSTITVTNVGTFGAESGTPIVNHPEAAILALGVLEPRALVIDGVVEARPAVTLSLTFDHRVLDGAQAGRALRDLGDLLESPFRLGALPRRSTAS